MKIKVNQGSLSQEYSGIEDMVVSRLDGAAHGNGQMETIQDTARNNSRAIGRLLRILHRKKKLSLNLILKICDGYVDEDTKIIEK